MGRQAKAGPAPRWALLPVPAALSACTAGCGTIHQLKGVFLQGQRGLLADPPMGPGPGEGTITTTEVNIFFGSGDSYLDFFADPALGLVECVLTFLGS